MSNTNVKKYSKISWVAFTFTISIILISSIPVIFPALFSEVFFIPKSEGIGVPTQFENDPFEFGILAIPLIVTNISVLIFFFLIRKSQLNEKIKTFTNFKISQKISIITVIILIGIYISISYTEIGFGTYHALIDEEYVDWDRLKNRIINMQSIWPDQLSSEPHFKHTLLKISQIIFGNFYVIPYMSSIGLLIITYLFTSKITNNRIAGIISLVLVLQSNLFLTFDTSATYASFWIMLYLLSLYAMMKTWPLSPMFYLLALFTKLSVILYGPLSLFFILNSEISKQRKIIITISISLIFLVSLGYGSTQDFVKVDWEWNDFWLGFTAFAFQLRLDGLLVVFLLPLTIGLFIKSKTNKYSTSILILIGGILLISPITSGFLNETNQPYRYLSLIVFFAVGVGLLFSRAKTTDIE